MDETAFLNEQWVLWKAWPRFKSDGVWKIEIHDWDYFFFFKINFPTFHRFFTEDPEWCAKSARRAATSPATCYLIWFSACLHSAPGKSNFPSFHFRTHILLLLILCMFATSEIHRCCLSKIRISNNISNNIFSKIDDGEIRSFRKQCDF